MAKPIGPICNLDCKYCFYLEKEKLYPGQSNWVMADEVLEAFIRQKIESSRAPVELFAWQGGEPTLLGVDFFRRVVALQKKYTNGKKIENAFQTNGILLDDEWCEFLAENRFLVGLSIDGPAELHDLYRVNKGDRPTFEEVMRGLEYLKKHGVEFNTLTVVHRQSAYEPLKIYHFLKEIGSTFMQFIPLVERVASTSSPSQLKLVGPDYGGDCELAPWSVEPEPFGDFLIAIFDEWVRKDVGRYFIQTFEVALESWLGMPQGLCIFRETCGKALAIEHNGDLYACDHYVYPDYYLGNILERPMAELVFSEKQEKFGRDKRDTLPRYCQNCEVRFACNGECPKHRFVRTPDGEEGLNYLCAGYKKFFQHIDPYMRFMANELRHKRDPSRVMVWAKERDQGFPSFNIGRNDPCPCGSGKKFKKCCGP
ncbi:MAG: anaerobic sulfatase-maturation protein [candidate division KSB1 bacterium]|nr:anaerobic sulfatase-maturation protein [candidate division KSB1 bacterium]